MSRHSRRRQGDSRVVMALQARREHGSTIEALRAAQPRTLRGYGAQHAALGAAATWRSRHALTPVSATAAAACTGTIWPGWTITGLLAAAAAQDVARRGRRGAWTPRERAAAATWAVGAAVWSAAHYVVPGGAWWQWLLGLGAATGAQSITWWRRVPEPEPVGPPIYVQAAAAVLAELSMDGGPLTHSQITAISMPAPQVVVTDVALAYGVHAEDSATPALRRTLQARLQLPAPPQVEALDANTLRITMSWSLALDEQAVTWRADRSRGGQVWLGLADDRSDIHLPTYTCGAVDAKVRVHHGWAVGRTGGGKSTTFTVLLLPGLRDGVELVLVADGKGDSLEKLEPYVARYARLSGARFEQVITLAWAIMRSRQARGWTGPSPTDPVVTLVIDEATTVKGMIDAVTQERVFEISRMGESLGVRAIQGIQTPTIEHLIGEGGYRANTRWVVGHVSADATYSTIAAQSTNEEVSLLGLPVGRAAVIVEGQVVSRHAKIAWVSKDDVREAMRGVEPAQLHPADMAAVKPLWDLTAGWSDQAAIEAPPELDPAELRLHRWFPTAADRATAAPATPTTPTTATTATTAAAGTPSGTAASAAAGTPSGDDEVTIETEDMTTGGRLRLVPPLGAAHPAGSPADPPPAVVQAAATASTARSWVAAQLRLHGPSSVAALTALDVYSRSAIFDAVRDLVRDGVLTKEGATYHLVDAVEPGSGSGGSDVVPPAVGE